MRYKYTNEDIENVILMMIIDLMSGVILVIVLKLVMHKQQSKVLRH